MNPHKPWTTWLLGAALMLGSATAWAQDLVSALREEIVPVPKAGLFTITLQSTYFRPPGDGPFPLVIINHGKSPGDPRFQPRYRPLYAARELVQRGYAVAVPMRQGFDKSGGSYIGGGCNVHSNGLVQAEDVQATLQAYAQRPEIDATRVVLMGQSHGGLTTLAAGTLALPGVRGLVNFAGGLRQEQCPQWQRFLADAFGSYAQASTLPALFFYGDNDSYWPVPVWQQMVAQYNAAGGRARVVAFGPFGTDAHSLFGARDGVRIWLPEVDRFFRSLGLPFDKQRDIALIDHSAPVPADTGVAAVDDVAALPTVLSAHGREGYAAFLAASPPRAFALGPTGAWSWRSGVADAMAQVIERCSKSSKAGPCKLYAVDDRVVWTQE
jgi:dienelactone hydrolase